MEKESFISQLHRKNKSTIGQVINGGFEMYKAKWFYGYFYYAMEHQLKEAEENNNTELQNLITYYMKPLSFKLADGTVVVPENYRSYFYHYNGTWNSSFSNISFFKNNKLLATIRKKDIIVYEDGAERIEQYGYEEEHLLDEIRIDWNSIPDFLNKASDFLESLAFEENIKEYLASINHEFVSALEISESYKCEDGTPYIEKVEYEKRLLLDKKKEEARAAKEAEIRATLANDIVALAEISKDHKEKIERFKIPEKYLFNIEDGVRKIDKQFLCGLKFIDLSNVEFKNVDVRGIDFTECNPILLNPQTVYNKDLSNTSFINDEVQHDNIFPFGPFTSFEGVNLSGASIIMVDPVMVNFNGAITDDSTSIVISGEKQRNHKPIKSEEEIKKMYNPLRLIRMAKDMHTIEFAEIFGVSPSDISAVEKGDREMNHQTLIKGLNILGVEYDEYLDFIKYLERVKKTSLCDDTKFALSLAKAIGVECPEMKKEADRLTHIPRGK